MGHRKGHLATINIREKNYKTTQDIIGKTKLSVIQHLFDNRTCREFLMKGMNGHQTHLEIFYQGDSQWIPGYSVHEYLKENGFAGVSDPCGSLLVELFKSLDKSKLANLHIGDGVNFVLVTELKDAVPNSDGVPCYLRIWRLDDSMPILNLVPCEETFGPDTALIVEDIL